MLTLVVSFAPQDGMGSDMEKALEGTFLMSVLWTVGAVVDKEGRRRFDRFLRILVSGNNKELVADDWLMDFRKKNIDYEMRVRGTVSSLPADDKGLLYDFCFNAKRLSWEGWLEIAPRFIIPRDAAFTSILVPTVDTERNSYVVRKLLLHGYHVL